MPQLHAYVRCIASLLLIACVVHATDYAIVPGKAKIAAIGDHGHAGPTAQAVSELVKSWSPLDAVIALGDVNYPRGSRWTIDENVGKYYSEFIYPYKGRYGKGAVGPNRFWPCPGNHDYGTARKRDLSPYLDYMPVKKRRFYDIRIGPVHVFSLDSDKTQARLYANASSAHALEAEGSLPPHVHTSSHSGSSAKGTMTNVSQALWLRRRLVSSNAPWKIVYFHHPPYSSGSHGSSSHMRWPFEEWGAVAVMSGHDHSYERVLIGDRGFPYFVNGMGGARTYGFQVQPISGSATRHTSRAGGAQLIEANVTTITFKFYSTSEPHRVLDCYMARLVPSDSIRNRTTTTAPPPAPAPNPSPNRPAGAAHPLPSAATLATPSSNYVIQYSTCDG